MLHRSDDRPHCRQRRPNLLRRFFETVRFRRSLRRCGDFLFDDPPPDSFVREPRRPRPAAPGGAVALELPDADALT
jgi:hypothetical protein